MFLARLLSKTWHFNFLSCFERQTYLRYKITGGAFLSNKADFGGFLYKKGVGSVSCAGASAEGNQAVDGGGVYAVENATLHWECDMVDNSALSGPAM